MILGQDWKYFGDVLQVQKRDPALGRDRDPDTGEEAEPAELADTGEQEDLGEGPHYRQRRP